MTALTVAALPSDIAGGCGHYRVRQPLRRLENDGKIKLVLRAANDGIRTVPFLHDDDMAAADAVIFQKCGIEAAHAKIGEIASKCIGEIDDALDVCPKTNPIWRDDAHFNDDLIRRIYRNTAACRVATTTTARLADHLGGHEINARVIPNGIDIAEWMAKPGEAKQQWRKKGEIRIGWIASRNHVEDADVLVEPMATVIRKYPQVTFVLAGGFYPVLKEYLGDRMQYENGVPIDEYPRWCRWLDLDVAVCPLEDTAFARCKSPLKWEESSAMGVSVVASNVGPYQDAITHEQTGMLAASRGEWVDALSALIEDASVRRNLADAALDQIVSMYSLDIVAERWWHLLQEVSS